MTNKPARKSPIPAPDPEQQRRLCELIDTEAALRERLSGHVWWTLADTLASAITTLTQLCAARALPVAEIKALWLAVLRVLKVVTEMETEWRSAEPARLRLVWQEIDQELRDRGVESLRARQQTFVEMNDWFHRQELRRLHAAIQGFRKAFYGRKCTTPQAKYAEARLSSRRALMEKHNPLLDGFPKLVVVLRTVCSKEAWAYLEEEVLLKVAKFLDALHIMAHDRAEAGTLPNPPARLRRALARRQKRQKLVDRIRWLPPTPEQSSTLQDPEHVESSAITRVDWEHGRRDLRLPPDQTQAVEARFDGLNLQSSEAADYLGWDLSRLEAVRRSLEADRPWGRKLRERFAAYDPEASENEKNKNPEDPS
jgi:hypothetical protein